MRRLSLSLGALLASVAISSCNGPCESLAERICSCEPNSTEEAGCLEQVRSEMDRLAPTEGQNAACEALLDVPEDEGGCSCDALEMEDFAACGLSKRE